MAPAVDDDWIRPSGVELSSDEAGAALREWRTTKGIRQCDLADRLGWTQQHLSQIENGKTFTIDQRRHVVRLLGIAPEDLGLSSRQSRGIISGDDVSMEIAASRRKWRLERSYLNHHRSQLAKLAVDLYPAEHRLAETTLIAHPDWLPAAPADLRSIGLDLDEDRQSVALDGSEPETAAVRPLRAAGAPFEQYTDAITCIDPPELFENRPSYRLLRTSLPRRLRFGLGVYFDKLNVSEALGHEIAAVAMRAGDAPPTSADQLRGQLPFRDAIGDPFDLARRANIPAITTLTIRLRPYPHEPLFLLHWRDPAKVATAGGTYDVIPAGEFQPSSVFPADLRNDFDLWRNMVREVADVCRGVPMYDAFTAGGR